MSVEETAKATLLPKLVKWLILGVFILSFRFLRWGGIVGMIGIGAFAGAIWLAFYRADPETGKLTAAEGWIVLALLIAGVVAYLAGVIHRRRRTRAQPAPPSDPAA